MTFQLHLGNCKDVMKNIPSNSIDSVVCDPPYELTSSKRTKPAPHVDGSPYSRHRVGVNGDTKPVGGFMGHEWDGSGIAYDSEMWAEVLRVLKPGGHLLSFGGTRTQHRMVCAIEDAGFEIRDQIQWVYGTGFPKSRNISKDLGTTDWDGWGTALKPAQEPICVARKPVDEKTVAANVVKYGTGAINIDGCRIPLGNDVKQATAGKHIVKNGVGWGVGQSGCDYVKGTGATFTEEGRWPANFIHDGSDEVTSLFPTTAGGRSGSASRFFYCAKPTKSERGSDNNHPTVKPLALMQYLVRMVTPPNGTVLDPFMGSGTTGVAALMESFNFIGIDMTPEYVDIAKDRITKESNTFRMG